MKFLVRIQVTLPASLSAAEREELQRAELARGRELVDSGTITAIWRIPGGLRNVGIWDVADATELDQLITALPMSRWLEADVTPLAEHPIYREES